MGRAEKEARKDAERQSAKCHRSKQPAISKRPRKLNQWHDQGANVGSVEVTTPNPGVRPAKQILAPPFGPCWRPC